MSIMPKNVEIKVKIKDFKEIYSIAENLCGSNPEVIFQEDTFFNISAGRLKLRNFKDGSDSQLIFYKRPDTEGLKTSDYSICLIKNHEELLNILKSALEVKGSVIKTRYLFLYGQTRIHIDQVQDLGNFLELEVVLSSNQTIEEAEEIANNILRKFGLSDRDFIKGAYIDLLQK